MVFVETKQEARSWLTSGRAKAVLALDSDVAGIFKETQFLQAGGTVVFPLTTGFEDCCFSEELGLPWKVQDYYRADFFPGSAAEELGILQDSIYNVKANLIKHVHPADVVFGPGEETWTQSMVWAPEHMGHQPGVAAAAFAATQGGHVGYVGDVNWEEASGEIVLAMLQHSTA